ncbi:protein decapping 5 isoform X2 [Pyrus x bretschneideri]|uniref:protein decapping 5 isoform X2 n=1 Tax=Pyrus x bretschneideri TaxID=225117 RepID=UPI0020308958|nr:protein decapping 5 isoform X2 [Pyrus x bretschneideri]
MATETAARSSSAADSYIGSLISLTSKSEIRYEGMLYNINTEESSIGLRNVRSFGTEGRKKDGAQIPPGDKVYEYILFRGSDIKDLQVKSSPPVQPTPPINNDPAIIQSHYSRPAPSTSSLPAPASGSLTDINSHAPQMGLPGPNFQGSLPLYQPGGNLASWGGTPPPPSANGMPMYWQGYYGPPNGLPHLHQQSLLRPPPGLSMPSSLQQPLQYANFTPSLPTGASNLPSNLPEVPPPVLPAASISSSSLTATSLSPSTLPTTLPPVPSTTLSLETLPSSMPNKAPSSAPSAPSAAMLSASLPPLSSLATSSPDTSVVPPISNKPHAISGPTLPYPSASQTTSSVAGTANSLHTETLVPSLVTPGQLLQSGSATVSSSQSLQTAHKDVEVVQVSSSTSSEPSVPLSAEPQPPILPLPQQPAQAGQKDYVRSQPNGAPYQNQNRQGYTYRGRERGRGTGSSRPITKFTEEFDFMAMNEKFNKDEVWGHLGKSNKPHKEGDGNYSDEDDIEDEDEAELSKPVYNKDDFFDTISCNSTSHDQNGRTRYSEQIKIDTETFGAFSRYRGGRGGRGLGRGGRGRGGYYGRGYGGGGGYVPRGRGRAMPTRAAYES